MTSTSPAPASPTRTTTTSTRIGLALAGLLAVYDLYDAYNQWAEDQANPFAYVALATGVATLVLIPFAWRGSSKAAWAVVLLRLFSGLSGLPVFFIPGIPAPIVITVAVGIVLAITASFLILVRRRA